MRLYILAFLLCMVVMLTLTVENIQVDAFIGFHEKEKEKPNSFLIDVSIEMIMPQAVITDSIEHTLDYAQVYDLVLEQMAIPCNLVEKKAYDIISILFQRFVTIQKVTLHIRKHKPCSMHECDSAGVEIILMREEYLIFNKDL